MSVAAKCTLPPPPGLGFCEDFGKISHYRLRCQNLAELRLFPLPEVDEFDAIVCVALFPLVEDAPPLSTDTNTPLKKTWSWLMHFT